MEGYSRRDFARLGAGLALGSMIGSGGLAQPRAAAPAEVDPLALVDPELRPIAQQMAAMPFPPLTDAVLPQLRATPFPSPPRLADVPVEMRTIPGPRGAPDVTVHVVNARAGGARPGILHTHGGGYVLGTAAGDVPQLQRLAQTLDCAIVTVDYRLAPETRFTGSIEDNYAGLKWLHGHAAELGVDPARIALMGESAGGGHAALLAIVARDRGEVPILFQSLIYPMLDDRTGSSRPVPGHIGHFIWTPEFNRYGWRSFLGLAPGGADVPAAAVPARVENLAGLPPAFIGVGAIDLFVDEDVEYARRLIQSGVPTELLVVPGAFHGFDGIAEQSSVAQRFNAAKIDALRRAFAAGGGS
ncbi:MAG: alpha/beta hydrolase [Allosphingosinicella sp.]